MKAFPSAGVNRHRWAGRESAFARPCPVAGLVTVDLACLVPENATLSELAKRLRWPAAVRANLGCVALLARKLVPSPDLWAECTPAVVGGACVYGPQHLARSAFFFFGRTALRPKGAAPRSARRGWVLRGRRGQRCRDRDPVGVQAELTTTCANHPDRVMDAPGGCTHCAAAAA